MLLPTRDRPIDLVRCTESILACDHGSFELIVIDQSLEPARMTPDPRLRLVASATRGKSAALNEAISVARADLLVFIDDDCTVTPNWLTDIEDVFARSPGISMMFGNLQPIDHDPSAVFIPAAEMSKFEIVAGRGRASLRGGAGASLATRRSLFDHLIGFDELIGPGSRFSACEEYDLYYRALAGGFSVARVPSIVVRHWGARSYADGSGRALLCAYAYGEGIVIGKHLHLRDPGMLITALRITVEDLTEIGGNLLRGRLSGSGLTRVAFKWRGVVRALVTPVDRRRRMFAA
ncbi:MAG: glycosyltransferase [Acidimicrobiales bacterium]